MYRKSNEEFTKLATKYYSEIMQNMSEPYGIRYFENEILDDSDWENLLNEPVLQIIYFDANDEMSEADQFMLCKDIKGFTRDSNNSKDEFVIMYDMAVEEVSKLFDLYIIDFLNSADKPEPKTIVEILSYNKNIIDIMFDMNYFNDYADDQLSDIYDLTDDERFLSEEVRDLFLF